MRTPDEYEGRIIAAYAIPDEEAVHHTTLESDGTRCAITRVVVTAWYDGQVDVDFYGKPLTRSGTVHKGRGEQMLWGDDRDAQHRTCKALGIDATAVPAVRAITREFKEEY